MPNQSTEIPISIVLPVYNAGEYLIPCLDSISSQTFEHFEVICILDCPTDGSDVIVKQYAQRDPRFHIIENEQNMHIGGSRNKGILASGGKYITFCDHDDRMSPNCLSIMYESICRTGCDVVGSLDFYAKGHTCQDYIDCSIYEAYRDMLTFRNTINSPSIWTHMYRKDFLIKNKIMFVDTKRISLEDRLFNCEVFANLVSNNNGETTYPIICQHLYEHGIEHTNGSADYRKFERIIPTLEKLLDVMDSTPQVNTDRLFYEAAGKILYSSFKIEIKAFGLFEAIKHLKTIKNSKRIISILKRGGNTHCKELTIPKNLLLRTLI